MEKYTIDHQLTGYLSPIIKSYLSGEKKLTPFYKYTPEIESFKKVLLDKENETLDRERLTVALELQYQKAGIKDPIVIKNIGLLRDSKTFTVTTGHQMCLFTGPLYFIYKILSTINLVEQLKACYPNHEFVPVYWMASEDHDFEEINHFNLYGNKIEWSSSSKGAVGKFKLNGLDKIIDDVEQILGDNENSKKMMSIFKKAYTQYDTLSDATRFFVNELFGKHGLVVIDADEKHLKSLMIDVFSDELTNKSSYDLVSKTNKNLQNDYKIQVNPREINLFYMKDQVRERIIEENGRFTVNNTSIQFDQEGILDELKTYPERFSPNVILRPVYQEKILPNIAYIGGGGELAYWFQLKTVFEHHKINFPMLILRNSVLLIDGGTKKKWNKVQFEIEDLFKSEEELIKTYMASHSNGNIELTKEQELIDQLYQELIKKAEVLDGSLKQSLQAEHAKQKKGLDNWQKKLEKVEKSREEVSLNQIRKIKEKLFPARSLQERTSNIIEYANKFDGDLIEEIKSNLDPLFFHFTILTH